MSAFYTTKQIAELLGVDIGKVTDWIAMGDLAAVNVAMSSGGIRPRWRISREALEQFIASRQTTLAAPAPARKKRRDERATEYH